MKGILFVESLYFATKIGSKTETRRSGHTLSVVNNNPNLWVLPDDEMTSADAGWFWNVDTREHIYCRPRYKVGEVLFLKEPYYIVPGHGITYKFDHDLPLRHKIKWENKMFMPEQYARVYIKIKTVRCERLSSISDESIIYEGIHRGGDRYFHGMMDKSGVPFTSAKFAYYDLFKKINKKPGRIAIENNNWVFVYTYELYKK